MRLRSKTLSITERYAYHQHSREEIYRIYGKTTRESLAGRISEIHVCEGIDPKYGKAGLFDRRAVTTESLGDPHSPMDVAICQDITIIGGGQIKITSSPSACLNPRTGMTSEKYGPNIQKIVPLQHLQRMKEFARKAGARVGNIFTQRYKDIEKELQPGLMDPEVGIQGDPLNLLKVTEETTTYIETGKVKSNLWSNIKDIVIPGLLIVGSDVLVKIIEAPNKILLEKKRKREILCTIAKEIPKSVVVNGVSIGVKVTVIRKLDPYIIRKFPLIDTWITKHFPDEPPIKQPSQPPINGKELGIGSKAPIKKSNSAKIIPYVEVAYHGIKKTFEIKNIVHQYTMDEISTKEFVEDLTVSLVKVIAFIGVTIATNGQYEIGLMAGNITENIAKEIQKYKDHNNYLLINGITFESVRGVSNRVNARINAKLDGKLYEKIAGKGNIPIIPQWKNGSISLTPQLGLRRRWKRRGI